MHVTKKLEFTKEGQKSRLFRNLNPTLARALSESPLTFHAHEDGLLVSQFDDDSFGLTKIFRILGTSLD